MNNPLHPTVIKKNWGLQGYTFFFVFLLLNIDCGIEAVIACTHDLCFKKNKKCITIFHLEMIIFTSAKYCSILHRCIFHLLHFFYINNVHQRMTKLILRHVQSAMK